MAQAKSAMTKHDVVVAEVVTLLEAGRRLAARSVNAAMTAVYWSIGQRIVEAVAKCKRCLHFRSSNDSSWSAPFPCS